jgi:hypothetical protein
VISDNADRESLLGLSNELDGYIVDYLKSKGDKKENPNFSEKSE